MIRIGDRVLRQAKLGDGGCQHPQGCREFGKPGIFLEHRHRLRSVPHEIVHGGTFAQGAGRRPVRNRVKTWPFPARRVLLLLGSKMGI